MSLSGCAGERVAVGRQTGWRKVYSSPTGFDCETVGRIGCGGPACFDETIGRGCFSGCDGCSGFDD